MRRACTYFSNVSIPDRLKLRFNVLHEDSFDPSNLKSPILIPDIFLTDDYSLLEEVNSEEDFFVTTILEPEEQDTLHFLQ